jgi:carboxyl-terminal processing protease
VVLVDRDSASASEIFAGAIQDYRRGFVVGEPTFGKGTVQNLVDLDRYAQSDLGSLGQLKVTIAQFFRVSGDSTQHRGIIPDLTLRPINSHENYGERTLENALPWSQIKAVRYRPFADIINEDQLSHLHIRHAQRVESDPKFRFLAETARLNLVTAEQKSVSLLESHRRSARTTQDSLYQSARIEYREAVGLTDEVEIADEAIEQAVLTEVGFILADIVIGSADPRNLIRGDGQSSGAKANRADTN